MYSQVDYAVMMIPILFLPWAAQASQIQIAASTFDSMTTFSQDWNFNYPWGNVHNGGARMDKSQVQASGGTLTLTAKRVKNQPPAGKLPINYLSGTVHAKKKFTVVKGGGYDFAGEFKATTTKGTWPAFWLTAVDSWPPEIDIAEWKGSGKISFNTFNSQTDVLSDNPTWPDPDKFHSIKAKLRDTNGKDLSIMFYLDGHLMATQIGKDMVGKAFFLIIDLQMEGSAGQPGPDTDTHFQVRNISVISRHKKQHKPGDAGTGTPPKTPGETGPTGTTLADDDDFE